MRKVGREGEGVARLGELVRLIVAAPDGQRAGEEVEELLAGVGVGSLARGTGGENKELRFELGRPARQLLDSNRVAVRAGV